MATRITQAAVRNYFAKTFCPAMGFVPGHKPGEYDLDYYGLYGGFKVVRMGEHGGKWDVFGQTRRSPREMLEMLEFTLTVNEERERRSK